MTLDSFQEDLVLELIKKSYCRMALIYYLFQEYTRIFIVNFYSIFIV